jgi:alkanesulfonate monooxygenase SsuD/methylene tetrahydromethanopterin reductase-like flavin-dependent oxidoreductase (luciferase family)
MHVGLSLSFQNLTGLTDREVYQHELSLADRAEGVGFDSVWTPEHHFSGYMLTPNVTQFLSWVAARTSRVQLGTMVTVLPWHDPVRVAENFALLDHLSNGRAVIGLGRGLGRSEFTGFRAPMHESRSRFTEYTEALVTGLESGVLSYDGQYYKQPPVEIRPAPFKSFRDRTFASAISPSSIDLMARLGIGLLVIAQKPWDTVVAELEAYRRRFVELNSCEPPKPVLCLFVAVSRDAREAQRMREEYLQNYAASSSTHYQFADAGIAEIEGYEYYAALSKNIAKHGIDRFNAFLADLQVWGTPEVAVERILEMVRLLDAGAVLINTSFGGMAPDVGRANFDLIVDQVLPALQAHDVGGSFGVTYGVGAAADVTAVASG